MQTQTSWYADHGDMVAAFINIAAAKAGLLKTTNGSTSELSCYVETEVKQGTALGDILMRPDVGMILNLRTDSPEWCQVTGKLTSAELAALLEFKSYRVLDDRLLRAMATFCKGKGIATCCLRPKGKVSFRFTEEWEQRHVQGLVNLNLVEVGLIYALENVGYGFHLDVPAPAVTNGNAHYQASFDRVRKAVVVGSPFGYSRDTSQMYPWGTGSPVPANDTSKERPPPVQLVFAAQAIAWLESKVKLDQPPSKRQVGTLHDLSVADFGDLEVEDEPRDDNFVASESNSDEEDEVSMDEDWEDSDLSEDSLEGIDDVFDVDMSG